jgi:hypothetical protein
MSIFEQYTGRGMYYTADELDRLRNPGKYGYTQASYNAFGEQAQRRAENRARADQASMDVIPYSQIGPGFSFGGYGGHTSEATAGLAGFGGDYNVYTSENYGSGDAGDRGGLPSYGVRPSYGQINQGIASLPFDDRDDSSQGNIAFYSDIMEGLKNMAYGPFSALTKVAYGVATNAPNTPYLVVDQETGKLSWSDGQSIADSLAMPASEVTDMTTVGGGGLPDTQPATSPSLMPDAFFAADQSLPAIQYTGEETSGVLGIPASEVGSGFDASMANYDPAEIASIVNEMAALGSLPAPAPSRPAPAPAPTPSFYYGDDVGMSSFSQPSYTGYDDFTAADFGGFSDPDPGDASGGFEM